MAKHHTSCSTCRQMLLNTSTLANVQPLRGPQQQQCRQQHGQCCVMTRAMHTYRRHPSDQTSTLSSRSHSEGTSKSSGALYGAVQCACSITRCIDASVTGCLVQACKTASAANAVRALCHKCLRVCLTTPQASFCCECEAVHAARLHLQAGETKPLLPSN